MSDAIEKDWIRPTVRLPVVGQRVRIRLMQPQEPPYHLLPAEVEATVKIRSVYGDLAFTPDWIKPDGNPWCMHVLPSQVSHWRLLTNAPNESADRQRRTYRLSEGGRLRKSEAMKAYWARKRGEAA
jgi:hypothetical protein